MALFLGPNALDMYAMGCPFCCSTTPIPVLLTSVSTVKGWVKSGRANTCLIHSKPELNECLLCSRCLLKGIFLRHICERLADNAIISHKFSVVSREPQEASPFLNWLRNRPRNHGLDSDWICWNTFNKYNMAQILNFSLGKCTFAKFSKQFLLL